MVPGEQERLGDDIVSATSGMAAAIGVAVQGEIVLLHQSY
jgi:hypothetical protein